LLLAAAIYNTSSGMPAMQATFIPKEEEAYPSSKMYKKRIFFILFFLSFSGLSF